MRKKTRNLNLGYPSVKKPEGEKGEKKDINKIRGQPGLQRKGRILSLSKE